MLKKLAIRFNIVMGLAAMASAYVAFNGAAQLMGDDPNRMFYGLIALALVGGVWIGGNMGMLMASAVMAAEHRQTR